MNKLILLVLLIFVTSFNLLAQAPIFNSVTPNTTTVQKFEKFELGIGLSAAYSNPYDYSEILVTCIFVAPGGRRDTVDGFFMQEYSQSGGTINPTGTGLFKVRYAPNETGAWSYILSCTTAAGTTARPAENFTCNTSSVHGFVRKNTTSYLNFDDGSQYIPIGENMGWQNGNVYTDYTSWLSSLVTNGGNFIRVWMSDWAFGLEWKNGNNGFQGLQKYKQSSAFWLDWLLEYCREKNVYLMLCLNHHGQVSTGVNPEWLDNPYNTANGGPCANTWDFFTNTTAKAFHKNRLRYIIARYGYSVNMQSWELFNEVEWTDQFASHKTEISNWHGEMAGYLKSKDVYKHLVTTSYAHDVNDPATWSLPSIDFTQTHFYANTPAIESILASASQQYLTQFSKPTLNGEFGLGTEGATLSADDPNGIHIHNAIWGSMLGGSLGTGMSWWWDTYIHPRNLYHHFKPLADYVSALALKDDNYKKLNASVTGGGAGDVIISPGAGFVMSPAANFSIDASGNMTPGPSQLSSYLFGNSFNTQNRNPPTFNVNFPVAGQFRVVVTSGTQGTLPRINIYIDGTEVLNQNAVSGSTYSVSVPAGIHNIKVDNLGTDWVNISSYIFTNIGSPLSAYILKSSDNKKVAGWLLNRQYNWKYLKDNGGNAPVAIAGATVHIPAMTNGNYNVNFYSCANGTLINTVTGVATNGSLDFPTGTIAWDIAFKAEYAGVATAIEPINDADGIILYPNPVMNELSIRFPEQFPGKYMVMISDFSGKLLLAQQVNVTTIDPVVKVPFRKFASGVFIVRLKNMRSGKEMVRTVVK